MNKVLHNSIQCLCLGLVLALCSYSHAQTIVYVDPNSHQTPHDGSDWDHGYLTLQDGLNGVPEEEFPPAQLWLAESIYRPDEGSGHSADDPDEHFRLPIDVEIYGGFRGAESGGYETSLSQRNPDPETNDTILSGYIGGSSNSLVVVSGVEIGNLTRLASVTIIGAAEHGIKLVDASPVFDWVIIRDCGSVTGGGDGGAVLCQTGGAQAGSSAIFTNCYFLENSGYLGGAARIIGALTNPSWLDCTFEGNIAQEGGAIHVESQAAPRLTRCRFLDNSSQDGGGAALLASAGYVNESEELVPGGIFRDCEFSGNISFGTGLGGGAVYAAASNAEIRGTSFESNVAWGPGGAVFQSHGALKLLDCRFVLNGTIETFEGSANGGALFSEAGVSVICCTFDRNEIITDDEVPVLGGQGGGIFLLKGATLHNNLLIRNQAARGGGLAASGSGLAAAHFDAQNCTFSMNYAEVGGGAYLEDAENGTQSFTSCIFWGNESEDSEVHTKQIAFGGSPSSAEVALEYSCIEDGSPGDSNIDYEGPSTGTIDLDPQFQDAENEERPNLRLVRCSPAIDSGKTPPLPEDEFNVDFEIEIALEEPPDTDEKTPDLDKRDRLFDEPEIADTGVEDEDFPDLIVDMGSYEHRTPLGDVFYDRKVDGKDIGSWVECFQTGPEIDLDECHAADMDEDNDVDVDDQGLFVCVLLYKQDCPAMNCEIGTIRGLVDCNENGTPDTADVFGHASADCNWNWIPDECDIDVEDPDGNEEVSNDVDGDGTPDECEGDCNENGTPDDFDLAEENSADVNGNEVPDECEADCNGNGTPDAWDVSQLISEDCDGNGRPDECDIDCNGNDVPDACDMDPEDPDGDEVVWADCNGNLWLDVCDMSLPQPYGSLDCNENGTPDECDIASEYSADCNENGFPDECDIAAEISDDANENGTPDECEEEMMMGGGGESMMMEGEGEGGTEITGETPMLPWEEMSWSERAEVMEEFRAWCREREWGPEDIASQSPGQAGSGWSGAEQFEAMVEMMRELGIPVRRD